MAEQLPGQMSLNDFIPAPEPQKEKFDILNYIPVGSKNAVKRKRLCFLTGLIDRKMRNLHLVYNKVDCLSECLRLAGLM